MSQSTHPILFHIVLPRVPKHSVQSANHAMLSIYPEHNLRRQPMRTDSATPNGPDWLQDQPLPTYNSDKIYSLRTWNICRMSAHSAQADQLIDPVSR